MTDIKLTNAAKYYEQLPHQKQALDWLESQIPAQVLAEFAKKYRAAPPAEQQFTNTWDGVFAAAKAAGSKWPAVTAAQWALESGWGKHTSGKNNYFGLKGTGSTVSTQEYINGQWITIRDSFIDFPDLYSCITYLVRHWYKDFGRYRGVNRASSNEECARLLVSEGYATAPDYAEALIRVMRQAS